VRELLAQHTGGASLGGLHQPVHTVLRIDFDQQVNVVGHDLHLHQPCPFLVHYLADEVLQAFFDPAS
jgi:hypothetical protein